MSLRPPAAAVRPSPVLTPPARRQHAHEHGRAYDAVELAAQRIELAGPGHAREVALLRAIRRRLARHLDDGTCDAD